jgi:hypothetical protein
MSYEPITVDFNTFKKEMLSNPKALEEYNNLEEEFALISELIHARKRINKTQKDVAGVMQTTATAISRLESVRGQKRHSPTLETLKRYAHAVGCKLMIKLVPEREVV